MTGRPLDRVASIKLKLALLVGSSILAAALVLAIGDRAHVPMWITVPVTIAAGLAVTHWLARGMTAPLVQMTEAASRMAGGDYTASITATSADEVATLARAFTGMARELAAADRDRRQLIATVSHELRTPLAAQQALLENLVDGVVRPDDAVLRKALAQTERLGALVADLLDLSRVDNGRTPLRLKEIHVQALCRDAVAEAEVLGRRVSYSVEVTPPGLTVRADPDRLAQLVANLLDNAGRLSPAGGGVKVRAGLVDDHDWFLEVADEGPGLDAEAAARIGTSALIGEAHGGGTGLGLAIAAWVATLHGGRLASVPRDGNRPEGGRGACLRATLPREPGAGGIRPRTASVGPGTADIGLGPVGVRPGTAGVSPGSGGVRPGTVGQPPIALGPVGIGPGTIAQPPIDAGHGSFQPPATAGAPAGPTPEEHDMTANAPAHLRPATDPAGSTDPGGRPFLDVLFGRFWPETTAGPQPRLLIGALAVGLVAALALPFHRLGLGAFVVLVLGGAVLLAAGPVRTSRETLAATGLCLALGSLTVLRDNEPAAVMGIAAAAAVAAVTATRASSFPAMIASGAAWVLAGLRGLPLLGATLNAASKHKLLWPVLRTVAVSVVLLVLFGGLFASADAIFGSWAQAVIPDLAWSSFIFRSFVWFFTSGIVLAGAYLALNPPRVDLVSLPPTAPARRPWEWMVPLGLLIVLFVGFLAAQGAATLGGHDYLLRTTGLTYADYVHQGFGQLTAATALTLVVIALIRRRADPSVRRDRVVLTAMLAAVCVLTLTVVASALYRMSLYQEAYGFTTLRLFVDGFELWLGVLVGCVLVAVLWGRWSWLARAALVSGAAFTLGYGVISPDAFVARQNIERYHESGRLDLRYLGTLSADALPAIRDGLPREVAACVINGPARLWEVGPPDGVVAWNLGRHRAAAVRAEFAHVVTEACAAELGGP